MTSFRHLLCALSLSAALLTSPNLRAKSFEIGKGSFLMDGKPFVIKAAELHYPRIPKPYWDHRIKMSKALGMNTICLYVFWNFHEAEPGVFDFSGDKNLREFIELCASNDMKVILRPGPYVCAEWEMGGLPWWLLKNEEIRLREQDPRFMERVERFLEEVGRQTEGLMDKDGGPIVMVQVENEYGSYGKDKPYVSAIRDILRKNFGEETVLFQCDWSSNFTDNGLDDLLWTMNFGTGADIDSQFAELKSLRPETPLMCSEYWSGWFDKWGANHETRPADEMIAGIGEMLDKGISFSLYMTHGGTNWGYWAGANSPGYAPDVTSYDYDAPITEYGTVTPKYHLLRDLLANYNEDPLPDIPDSMPIIGLKEFSLNKVAPLWNNLPKALTDTAIRPMEMYNQGFGSIIYSFKVPEDGKDVELIVDEPHDFAQVFVNGEKRGILDRRKSDKQLKLGDLKEDDRIDILVEAMGRINFGRAIKDYKGISGDALLVCQGDSFAPMQVEATLLPDDLAFYKSQKFKKVSKVKAVEGHLPAGVYTGTFKTDSIGDTFLDMSGWGKGLVYVNGHALGRFWEIGPQQTLYLPGCWLKKGKNEVVVYDILGPVDNKLRGLKEPIIDSLKKYTENKKEVNLPEGDPLIEISMAPGNGWQTFERENPSSGQVLWIEIKESCSPEAVSLAELQLLDREGEEIPNETWRIKAISGEDTATGNHTGDKLFDRQESTYWRSAGDLPQVIAIDLGKEYEIGSIRILPRMESGAPEAPTSIRLLLTP